MPRQPPLRRFMRNLGRRNRATGPNRVAIGDPYELTTVSDAEVSPREAGLSEETVEAIWEAVLDYYYTGLQTAIGLCIRRRGRIAVERTVGYARGNAPDDPSDAEKVLATPDTIFCAFSATKAVTAMLIHLLDDRGLLHLDDPVATYIPEFARHGKGDITLRHILIHKTGLIGLPTDREGALDLITQRDQVLQVMCDARPEAPAGRQLAYGALAGGFILGEVAHRVSGKPVDELLTECVREPLGLDTFGYGVRPDQLDRVPDEAFTGPDPFPPFSTAMERGIGLKFQEIIKAANDVRFRTSVVPSGNIYATCREASLFFEALMRGGQLDPNAPRVFEERTIARATAEQSYHELDRVIGLPIRYSMGFMLGSRYLSFYGPGTGNAFGHLGFTNKLLFADPDRDISVALMCTGNSLNTLEHLYWLNITRTIATRIPRVR